MSRKSKNLYTTTRELQFTVLEPLLDLGLGGGQVVGVVALFSNDTSSDPFYPITQEFHHEVIIYKRKKLFLIYLKKFFVVENPDAGGPVLWHALDRDGRVQFGHGAHLARVPASEVPTENVGRMLNELTAIAQQFVELVEGPTYTQVLK